MTAISKCCSNDEKFTTIARRQAFSKTLYLFDIRVRSVALECYLRLGHASPPPRCSCVAIAKPLLLSVGFQVDAGTSAAGMPAAFFLFLSCSIPVTCAPLRSRSIADKALIRSAASMAIGALLSRTPSCAACGSRSRETRKTLMRSWPRDSFVSRPKRSGSIGRPRP